MLRPIRLQALNRVWVMASLAWVLAVLLLMALLVVTVLVGELAQAGARKALRVATSERATAALGKDLVLLTDISNPLRM